MLGAASAGCAMRDMSELTTSISPLESCTPNDFVELHIHNHQIDMLHDTISKACSMIYSHTQFDHHGAISMIRIF